MFQDSDRKKRLEFSLFVILISFLSGVAGASLLFYYVVAVQAEFPAQNVTIEKRENVTVVSEQRWQTLISELSPSVAAIVRRQKRQNAVLEENDFLGYGVFATNDGWLALPSSVYNSLSREAEPQVLTYNRELFSVDKILDDPSSGISLVKISSSEFKPANFASIDSIKTGREAALISFDKKRLNLRFFTGLVSGFGVDEKLNFFSSENVSRYPVFSFNAPLPNQGAAVDLNGNFIAFAQGETIIPFYPLKKHLESLLAKGKSDAAYLGLNYVDLSASVGGGERRFGSEVVSVKKGSPAQEAGIKVGDIVVTVDNDEVKEIDDLSQILMDLRPGQKIKVGVLRGRERMEFEVKLGAQ